MYCDSIKDELELLHSRGVSEILKDGTLQMQFFRTYQAIFGVTCRLCEKSIRDGYTKLINNGKQTIEKMNAIKERTNKPAWNGLKFIRQAGEHYHADLLTDELAISLLKRGFLTEKDFVILPKIEAENQAELNCIAEFKEKLKQGATQEDLFEQYKNVGMIGDKKVTKKYLISLIDKANEA